jgi:hypothetical protein
MGRVRFAPPYRSQRDEIGARFRDTWFRGETSLNDELVKIDG